MKNLGTPEKSATGPTEEVIADMNAVLRGEEPQAQSEPDGTHDDPEADVQLDGDAEGVTNEPDADSEPADAKDQATSEPIAKPRLEWPRHLRDKLDKLDPEARKVLEEAYEHQHKAATKEYTKKLNQAHQTVQQAKALLGEATSLVPLDPKVRYRNVDGSVMTPEQQQAYNNQWTKELHDAAATVGVEVDELFADPKGPAAERMLALWKKGYEAVDAVRLVAAEFKPAPKKTPSRPPRGSASTPTKRTFGSVQEHMDAIISGEVRE